MVKLPKKFSIGEKVFAKVRGYPPWPAKIETIIEPNTKNAKYHVIFYGTGEIGTCKIDDIFSYAENKEKLTKSMRRKYFQEGIQELEEDLRNFPNDPSTSISQDFGNESSADNTMDDSEKESESTAETSTLPFADSDIESGNLIIDENEKKKALKRKSIPVPQSLEIKRRGRKSFAITIETIKQDKEVTQDSADEDLEKKNVSRSGRKIKPKRFHDSSDMVNTLDASKNETTTAPNKKRINIEKKDSLKDVTSSQEKLDILRDEMQLLLLDSQIRSSLSLYHAETDHCLEALNKILQLNVTPLMLKKQPQVMDTIRRLRKYIGNLSDWKLSEEDTIIFKRKAETIRKKAEKIYAKFKELFPKTEGKSFWDTFTKEVKLFKEIIKDKPLEEMLAIVIDPTDITDQKCI